MSLKFQNPMSDIDTFRFHLINLLLNLIRYAYLIAQTDKYRNNTFQRNAISELCRQVQVPLSDVLLLETLFKEH
jgi:hypothetical protein